LLTFSKQLLCQPRDVFYDEDAKTALHRLKEPTRKLHQEEEYSKASELFLSELDSSGDRHRTTMTLCGYKGGSITSQINQDRSILVSPFLHEYQIVGVLDGHGKGGEIVAEFARKEIPIQVSAKLEEIMAQQADKNLMTLDDATTEKIVQSLKDVFLNVDKAAPSAARSGGATASLALQLGGKLFVANAGDSTTLVVAHRAWNESNTIIYATREDKPDLPEERERIEKAGGEVQIPKPTEHGDSPRVLYTDPVSKSVVGLAMSRSIGDWDAPGVTAEPVVDVLDLPKWADTLLKGKEKFDCSAAELECGPPDVNFFVVSATDGLFDFVKPQEVADKIGITFFGRPSLRDRVSGVGAGHAHLAAEELIYLAAKGWHEDMQGAYRDDITVAATKVFPWAA
jgi:serine/threonine protein phosphatase PrpC